MPTLDHQSILITGGAAGLGRAMARLFHRAGHTVTVCARTQADLDSVAAELPGVRAIRADIGDAGDRRTLMATATSRGLDILINNAAVTRAHDYKSDFTLSADRARDEVEINFAGPIDLVRLFLDWRRTSGRQDTPATIVNVNTPGALFPLEANPVYCATKAGLHIFTEALRRQLADSPVSVVAIFPPALDTGLARDLEVASQAANGDEVIGEVAQRCVDGILDRAGIVLPHPDAEMMYRRFAYDFTDDFVDQINAGVKRRAGWDAPAR